MLAVYSSLFAPPPALLNEAEDHAVDGQVDGLVFELNIPTSAVMPAPCAPAPGVKPGS